MTIKESFINYVEKNDEFLVLEDGFSYFMPNPHGGALSSWMLRTLADELDRRNEGWQKEINAYFEDNPE